MAQFSVASWRKPEVMEVFFFYVHVTVHRNKPLYSKTNRCTNFPKFACKIGMELRSIPILHASCLQTCITCVSAGCTVENSWRWAGKLPETCRVSYQNKFGKLVRLLVLL